VKENTEFPVEEIQLLFGRNQTHDKTSLSITDVSCNRLYYSIKIGDCKERMQNPLQNEMGKRTDVSYFIIKNIQFKVQCFNFLQLF
jgi:hypothetical protein